MTRTTSEPPRCLKKRDLYTMSLTNEAAIISVEEGKIVLKHLQADVEDEEGNVVGSIVFNGWRVLGLREFTWTERMNQT